jgi:hypothetical protein
MLAGMKIETTTKKFREGVKVSKGDEVRWESTGHLSVRLFDSSGTVPLAKRAVKFSVPKEGTIEKETDDDGKVFHPDVPFQDYELDLGDGVKVHAAAVANRDEVLDRYVFEVELGFTNLVIREADGMPIGSGRITITSAEKTVEAFLDDEGILDSDEPLPVGEYELSATIQDRVYKGKVTLDNRMRQIVIATVQQEEGDA